MPYIHADHTHKQCVLSFISHKSLETRLNKVRLEIHRGSTTSSVKTFPTALIQIHLYITHVLLGSTHILDAYKYTLIAKTLRQLVKALGELKQVYKCIASFPDPSPVFCRLQYGKTERTWGFLSHKYDVHVIGMCSTESDQVHLFFLLFSVMK